MTGNKPMMVAAILLATVACTVAVDWEPASLITADTLPPCRVSMNNAWGVQAYDNDGNGQDVVHVAYWNETNGYNDVHYLRTTNSGTDWNELFDISDPEDEDNACQPAVAVWGSVWNNHELCVAFYDEDEISEDQRYSIMSRRNDSCGEQNDHWKSIDRRSGSSAEWDEDCSHPSAATSQGPSGKYYLHVVWDDWHDDQLGSVIWYDITPSMKCLTVLGVTLSILIPCHPERSEGSLHSKILRRRTPQNDKHFLLPLVTCCTTRTTTCPTAPTDRRLRLGTDTRI
jgi:hypothetical protein